MYVCYNYYMENNKILQNEYITYQNIIKDDNEDNLKILRSKSKDVSFPLSDEDAKIVTLLEDYLYNASIAEDDEDFRPGVGLAAPQIGINKNIFAVDLYDPLTDDEYIETFINPKIVATSEDFIFLENGEGCLSVERPLPNNVTPRYRFLRIKYNNIQGEEKNIKLYNYKSIVFQHEYDHLIGKMYYDNYISRDQALKNNFKELILTRKEENNGENA